MSEILFGFIAGIIAALGMGGGSILILLLSIFTENSQKMIQGVNLIFFIPTAIIAIIINLKNKNIDLNLSKIISVLGIIGSFIGSYIALKIPDEILKKAFIIFLIIITIYEIYTYFKKYIFDKDLK